MDYKVKFNIIMTMSRLGLFHSGFSIYKTIKGLEYDKQVIGRRESQTT